MFLSQALGRRFLFLEKQKTDFKAMGGGAGFITAELRMGVSARGDLWTQWIKVDVMDWDGPGELQRQHFRFQSF
jgi:hypothetical protein